MQLPPPTEIPKSLLEDTPESVFLPYQSRWLADESGFKIYTKSRRIGITWADAAGAALKAAQTKGKNTFYLGYEKLMSADYIKAVADWAKAYELVASEIEESEEVFRDGDEDKAIQVFKVVFNSGFRVEALSSVPRNLRGKQGDVVADEGAFHKDLTGVLKAAKALRLWGGNVRVITTYNGVDEPYYALEQDVLAGKLPYSRHFTTFFDAVQQGLFKRICLMTGQEWSQAREDASVEETLAEFGEDADEELLCIPSRSGGKYFPLVLIERCMRHDAPVLSFACKDDFVLLPDHERQRLVANWLQEVVAPVLKERLDPNLKSFYGMDFARSGDLSVDLFAQELPNLCRAAVFGLELRNVPFEQQRQILFWIVDKLPRFCGGAHDARGNGQFLSEVAMQRYGAGRIHQVMFTTAWYAENFPRYRSAMEDGNILLPPSTDWKDDHRVVETIRGNPGIPDKKNKGSDGKQRHGDSAIAGVLMHFASEQTGGPIDFEPVEVAQQQYAGVGGGGLDGFTFGSGLGGYL
jgi:phage FluMu gp28-like protein